MIFKYNGKFYLFYFITKVQIQIHKEMYEYKSVSPDKHIHKLYIKDNQSLKLESEYKK